ncbi:MAG: hypothetical protein IJ833_03775 [Lachnospiraceae bacterium]|nr:hypothetical protein [Lachnospiraceae bacterium]
MRVKCDYCDSYFEDSESYCPSCGAANNHIRRTTGDTPRTIEELKAYCEQNGYTAEKTRFFIGEDYQGAKAFGIYRDSFGEYVVYKNKEDGSRAVRYQGTDEAYAVNEIYQRLQTEVINQKNNYINHKMQRAAATQRSAPVQRESAQRKKRRGKGQIFSSIVTIAFVILGAYLVFTGKIDSTNHHGSGKYGLSSAPIGYYMYQNRAYYHSGDYNSDWYYWDRYDDDWHYNSRLYKELPNNMRQYLQSSEYIYNPYYADFADSAWYEDSYTSYDREDTSYYDDDDWDSGWDDDWSSDDWDSGATDWDSDW